MKNLHKIASAGIPKNIYLVAQNYFAMVGRDNNLKFRYSLDTDTLWYWIDRNNTWTVFPKEHYKYWTTSKTLTNNPQIEIV